MKKLYFISVCILSFIITTGFTVKPKDVCMVYAFPNTGADMISVISQNSEMEVVQIINEEWYRINLDGVHGYIECKNTIKCESDENLIIDVIGDSITNGYGASSQDNTYGGLLGRILHAKVKNYGINGATLAGYANAPIAYRYQVMDDTAKIIIVFAGTNDFYFNIPVGNLSDTTSATFYGGLEMLMSGLKNSFSDSRIIFLTPLKRTYILGWNENNTQNENLEKYCEAIISMCQINGFEVMDLFHAKELDFTHELRDMPDGLHLSDTGHEKLGEYILKHL